MCDCIITQLTKILMSKYPEHSKFLCSHCLEFMESALKSLPGNHGYTDDLYDYFHVIFRLYKSSVQNLHI